ncbi:protein-disulfide reductase DsbD domain-containing protein [Telmatobacter bradus]|uniref:protein-disulfide reductase DsbD domain-containing protein n=1 Tax=Telmatobacter bradus TaxID=474953 RepID=UPI003B439E63
MSDYNGRLIRVRYFSMFLGVIFLFCLPAQAASPQVDAPHLRVKLVVADEALYAGLQPNDVGVFFSLEPGWHIYWMNPGDAGEPPHFHWTLPEGVTASAVQFPVPERIALGSMADYGYKGDVLFPVKLQITTVPKSTNIS